MSPFAESRPRAALRVALSSHVTNGASAAVGLALIAALVHLLLGPFAAAAATVGVIVVVPPDQPAPRRGKFWHLLPPALIGPPLFFAIQELHQDPFRLAALLVPATFLAFLGAAWGKRGLPISISVMFSMIFSMAMPPRGGHEAALQATLYFALGGAAYLVYATLANAVLNGRYRVLTLVDALRSVARLMRTQARHFTADDGSGAGRTALLGRLLAQQAALSDQLQAARDILLESPRTPRRQQLAGMLMQVLELRDHLVACELDLDTLKAQRGQLPVLGALRDELAQLAAQIDQMADALLLHRVPAPLPGARALPSTLGAEEGGAAVAAGMPPPQLLARALVSRVGHIHDEVQRLVELARGDVPPDLAVVRAMWQMFVSPTGWSWRPLFGLWRWDAPPLRHAIRAALAIATGQAIAMVLPWGTHDYWILLTIVVVLRGSLAQTLERRNSRVAGTLLGCLLAGAILMAHPSALVVILLVTVAQGVAHAFAIQRYLITAVAATILALLQAHQLNAGLSPTFEVLERIADTLIGVGISWAFSYVLPSWERTQIPALVARTLAAQAAHAQQALALGQLRAVDNQAELGWRLARREAYDSLSALVQATQRSLVEPRAVQPPLDHLERLLAHSYQLLAQLTAVKTMLLQRRGRLDPGQIQGPLQQAAASIETALAGAEREAPPAGGAPAAAAVGPVALPDPFEDLSPWLVRRLQLASGIARQVRAEARQAVAALQAQRP
ncbi:FUSC family protein [Ramlibacter sp.]|uniref:FUSC family protein n=1 Tax=Ramlibacter sp. TaxID=1917967 RepID=UPI002BF1EA5A|nr:FUSC family membrane protein [Ramlibacter sp.]HWI83603.1 FUSC family membrane protein [Ramlibacter sp.]